VVSLLGYDVWRISRSLRLSPEHFVLAHDQPEPANDGFLLEPGGWPQGLALDKRGEFQPSAPCVFLVELGGGHARCGIYEHRPGVCRTYPMALRGVTRTIRDDRLCPPDAWTGDELKASRWQPDLRSYGIEWERYVEVVDGWNRRVQAGTRASVPRYLEYLMNAYDRMQAAPREQQF
jgi:Fe-S-cluster containining protein